MIDLGRNVDYALDFTDCISNLEVDEELALAKIMIHSLKRYDLVKRPYSIDEMAKVVGEHMATKICVKCELYYRYKFYESLHKTGKEYIDCGEY
jgi:hypothetical protein